MSLAAFPELPDVAEVSTLPVGRSGRRKSSDHGACKLAGTCPGSLPCRSNCMKTSLHHMRFLPGMHR